MGLIEDKNYFERKPIRFKIIEVIKESVNEKYTLKFDSKINNVIPGQFLMAWIPGTDEIPLCYSYNNGITFQVIGEGTSYLSKLKKDDFIWLRGPFGTGFSIPDKNENILLVAGGVGVAPIGYLFDCIDNNSERKVTILLGAKTKNDLIFFKRFQRNSSLIIATDDGSYGYKGTVLDLLSDINVVEYDRIYTCGPEMMMYSLYLFLKSKNILMKSEFSLERYFKCGIGICGSCCVDGNGFRICKDGPVISGPTLLNIFEFGKYKRTESGNKIEY